MGGCDSYLDLVERLVLRDGIELGDDWRDLQSTTWTRHVLQPAHRMLGRRGYRLVTRAAKTGDTMVGRARLDVVRMACETVLSDRVPGDFLEAGVWRGGVTIFMRAALAAYDDHERRVWVADSFEGVPPPTPGVTADDGATFHERALAVGIDDVKAAFAKYGLLDDQVQFLQGWFADTLPGPVEQLAVLRLDGDLYESTWDSITALYPKVSPGGFVILDDYAGIPAAKAAVDDYRAERGITDPITEIDNSGWWRVTA